MRALHRKSNAAVTSRTHTLGRLWYTEVGDTVDYAKFGSHSHDVVIHVYDGACNVIQTLEHKGDFKEW